MTPDVGKRAPFELLAFTAAPVAGGLVVIELEGRFAAQGNGRFTRRPVLVVEADDDRPRLELAPVRAERHDAYWRGAYAIPAEALTDARFALGLRGTLLELPAPDEADDTARLAALAREANGLRRALEAAEAGTATARADEHVAEVRREADATLAETTAGHEQALAELTAHAEASEQRAVGAEARAAAAEKAARAAEAGMEVLRAELAEERERSRAAVAEDPDATTVRPPAARHIPTGDPLAAASTHTTQPRGPGPWIAVAALALFAFVLLGLLLGFLA